MKGNKNNTGLVVALIIFIILSLVLGGYLVYDKLNTQQEENKSTESNIPSEKNNEVSIDNKNNSINKRLYNVDSEDHKQRYYLLLDDATYDMNQNFLNKKTYILDLNMVNGNEIVKEINLSSVLTPIANTYINNHKGNNVGTCSVEYFSANIEIELQLLPMDPEKEVAFKGYYRCVNNNVETSLGSEIYAYNVETNTIRILASGN